MNICVCIKQVPDTNRIKIDPETNTLVRKGVPSIINPFDTYAVEMAAGLKELHGGRVIVVSMGPAQAREALRVCLSVGADAAYLVSDRSFGGSDTLATGYILAGAIRRIEELERLKFDLIFCGKQAIDGDTAQVGPQLAEQLGLPQVSYALGVSRMQDPEFSDGKYADEAASAQEGGAILRTLIVKREVDGGYDIMGVRMPAVVTVVHSKRMPRYATYASRCEAKAKAIGVLDSEALEAVDLDRCGLSGSPTRVVRTYTPVVAKEGVTVEGDSADETASALIGMLDAKKLL